MNHDLASLATLITVLSTCYLATLFPCIRYMVAGLIVAAPFIAIIVKLLS